MEHFIMFDLSMTTPPLVAPSTSEQRLLILVDRAGVKSGAIHKVTVGPASPPASVIWMWVVTPGAVVSWGALLAEPGDRTRLLLAALGERMEEARRCIAPLQRACALAEIPCQTHIVHGAVIESVVRLARTEPVDQVLLLATDGTLYDQPGAALGSALAQRLPMAVRVLE
jgi:hypothetical protein